MEVTSTVVPPPPVLEVPPVTAAASPTPVAAAPIAIKGWYVAFDDNGFSLKGHRVENNSEVCGNLFLHS